MALSGGAALASPAVQTNLLQNPGFNDPFVAFSGNSTRMVAQGWTPWNVPQRAGDQDWRNLPPEYQPATASNPARVREGNNAQEYFSFFATHTGGVYQTVRVPAGAQVQFSVFVYVWSTQLGDVNRSEDPGRVQVQVGIDPNGGTDGEAERIIWSMPLEFYDEYRQVSVETTANSDMVTVFVRTSFDQPKMHNNVYLDEASLVVSGVVPTATATPTGTFTAIPTATSTPTPTATVTAAPPTQTQVGFPTPTQEVGTGVPTDVVPTTAATTATTPPPGQPTATLTPTTAPGIPPDFDEQVIYRVVAGDTVGAIAQRLGSTVAAIIAANGLNSDALIFVGQELVIPVREAIPTPFPTPIPTTIGIRPTPTQPVTNPGTGGPIMTTGTFTVRRGDTLIQIAALYNTTVAALAQLNGIVNPNLIRAGQVLTVPIAAPPVPTPTPVPQPTQPRTHIVQRGENAFRISLRYGITMQALIRANGLTNPNLIFAGQVLVIP